MRNKRISIKKVIFYICLLGLIILLVMPILWAMLLSLKTNNEIVNSPLSLPQTIRFENYQRAIDTIFHVGSLSLTDELSRNAEFIALKAAKNNGIIISYDPNYRASLWDSQEEACKWMRSILEYADIVKVSEEEIELLTGYTDVRKAAESITEYGAKIVLITLGEKGSFVYLQDQQEAYVSGYSSKVVDTTGAGDSFMGGFLYKICESGKHIEEYSLQEMIECVRFGNAVASLCVEREGAIPAMPVMEEVIKRINS